MTGRPHVVGDVMTAPAVSVDRSATFRQIVKVLRDHRISAVPVVAAGGSVVGVVSEADLVLREKFRDRTPGPLTRLLRPGAMVKVGAVHADRLMTSPAVTVGVRDSLPHAARVMAKHRVQQLPVLTAEGILCGVITRGDLLKVFLRSDADIAEEVRRDVTARLFPGDPRPIRVRVLEGVVTLSGHVDDPSRVAVAARMVRAVEGVVGMHWDLDASSRPHSVQAPPFGPLL